MNLELSRGLKKEECEEIAYLYQLPTPEASNFNLNVLSSLEANGYTFPWNIDCLESLLSEIHRLDLLPIITRYKDSKEYKESKEYEESLDERSKRKKTGTKTVTEADTAQLSNSAHMASNKLKVVCDLVMTHASQLTQMLNMLHVVLEDESIDRAVEKVAKDCEELEKNMQEP